MEHLVRSYVALLKRDESPHLEGAEEELLPPDVRQWYEANGYEPRHDREKMGKMGGEDGEKEEYTGEEEGGENEEGSRRHARAQKRAGKKGHQRRKSGRFKQLFDVAPTPEAYTSKTCCRCLCECGPWAEKETAENRKIRGLRRCTQRDCMIPLNRDRNGATNIGTNFNLLMADKGTIRSMSEEDLAFHHAAVCLECD